MSIDVTLLSARTWLDSLRSSDSDLFFSGLLDGSPNQRSAQTAGREEPSDAVLSSVLLLPTPEQLQEALSARVGIAVHWREQPTEEDAEWLFNLDPGGLVALSVIQKRLCQNVDWRDIFYPSDIDIDVLFDEMRRAEEDGYRSHLASLGLSTLLVPSNLPHPVVSAGISVGSAPRLLDELERLFTEVNEALFASGTSRSLSAECTLIDLINGAKRSVAEMRCLSVDG